MNHLATLGDLVLILGDALGRLPLHLGLTDEPIAGALMAAWALLMLGLVWQLTLRRAMVRLASNRHAPVRTLAEAARPLSNGWMGGMVLLTAALPLVTLTGLAGAWGWSWCLVALCLIGPGWVLWRLADRLKDLLAWYTARTPSPLDDLIVALLGQVVKGLLPIALGWLALRLLVDVPALEILSDHLLGIAVTLAVAWTAFQATGFLDRLILAHHRLDAPDNLQARRLLTQVSVIRRVTYLIITVLTVACLLMQFEGVRQLGASILASAGVASLVIGLAAQRTLANLLAGLQIALTQPIRLDDVVIVEGEWGRIEEITLTYVVIAIWDQRRLVVPISHFIERPFQNWTRTSAEILGTVTLRTAPHLEVDALRQELARLLAADERWDGRVQNVQVTDAGEHSIEVRVLVSARDASLAWDLRCHLRERLLAWLAACQPQALPRIALALGPGDQPR